MFTKKNLTLLAVLIILAAGAYLYSGPFQNWRDSRKKEDQKNFLAAINMELVNKIEVTTNKGEVHTIIKEGGTWRAEPDKWPAEQIIMDSLEKKLTNVISEPELDIASLNAGNKVNFEVDEANGLRVKLFQWESNEVANFIIGKVTSDYQGTYISRDNDDKTYKVKETFVRVFDVEGWRDLTITNIGGAVDTAVFKYPNQEVEITNIPDSRGEVYWRSVRPYAVRLNKEKTEAFVNAAAKLEAIAIPAQDSENAGFGAPSLQIQLKGDGVDETLIIGNKNQGADEYFIKRSNDNKIYLITKDNRDGLAKQIVDLR